MKRWVVVLLIVLAVVVLISPGIVGRLAEKNIAANIDWAQAENPRVSVTQENFDRGWFTSEGRHRVEFSGGALRTVSGSVMDNIQWPTLIIDTRIDHGLVPVTSLAREAGSLLPGLANTVSTFTLDTGSGQTIAIPGHLYSSVGVTGASQSRLVLEAGEFADGNLSGEWQDVDLNIESDPATGDYSIVGSSKLISLSQQDGSMRFGDMTIDVSQTRSDYGFDVGTAEMAMGPLEFQTGIGSVSMGSLSFAAVSNVNDKRLTAESQLSASAIVAAPMEELGLDLKVAVARLDAESLGVIIQAMQQAQNAQDPQLQMQMLYSSIQNEVQKLVASGGELRFDQLDVSIPQGKLESTLKIEFGALDDDAQFSWPAALLAMTANLDLRIPESLYDFALVMSPEVGTLVAMGVLTRDGDDYVMDAEYAQGLLNVNGAPMPIPMPGL